MGTLVESKKLVDNLRENNEQECKSKVETFEFYFLIDDFFWYQNEVI